MMIAAAVGVLLLIVIAVCIGASLDTERNRAAAREAAGARRERTEQLRALRTERLRLRDERIWLAEERLRRGGAAGGARPS